MSMNKKSCSRCLKNLPVARFKRQPSKATGRADNCRRCDKARKR